MSRRASPSIPRHNRIKTLLRTPEAAVFLLVFVVVCYLVLPPLGFLLWQAFTHNGNPSLSAFARAFLNADTADVVRNSAVFAFGAAGLSVAVGSALAYLTERTDTPLRVLIAGAALVPIVVPGLLYTIAWVFLAGPGIGLGNAVAEGLFGVQPFNVFSLAGMVFVQGVENVPLVFLMMTAALRTMDPALEEAALVAGSGRMRVALAITLPLARPALVASGLIMFVRNVESFETPQILGVPNNIWVATTRIYRVAATQFPPDYGQAAAYSVILLAFVSLVLLWQSRAGRPVATVGGRGYRAGRIPLGGWRWPAAVAAGLYLFVAVVLPVAILAYISLQPFYRTPDLEALRSVSFGAYRQVFVEPLTLTGLRNSSLLGAGAATIAMSIAALTAFLAGRSRLPGRRLLEDLSFTPIVTPGIVLGVAILFFYLRNPLPVYGTSWILLIAYVTRFLPYATRYAGTAVGQLGADLDEAAIVVGAGWWRRLVYIMLPLMAPGLIAGWIYIFIVALRELSVSLLLYPPGGQVLAVVIWSWWYEGSFAKLSALGMLMILTLAILTLVMRFLGGTLAVGRT